MTKLITTVLAQLPLAALVLLFIHLSVFGSCHITLSKYQAESQSTFCKQFCCSLVWAPAVAPDVWQGKKANRAAGWGRNINKAEIENNLCLIYKKKK